MIKVVFFARLREQLAMPGLAMDFVADETVFGLAQRLQAQIGDIAEVLLDEETVYAVDQAIVDRDFLLVDGSEVAFFPPVTGG